MPYFNINFLARTTYIIVGELKYRFPHRLKQPTQYVFLSFVIPDEAFASQEIDKYLCGPTTYIIAWQLDFV